MKKTTHFIMLTVALLFSTVLIAQSTITGTVIEAGSNIPLPGANIIEKGTTNGVTSDFDGNFTIKTQESSGELVITFIGYTSKTISFSGDATLESIALESSQVGLEEVQIIASVAVDRKTPVAVSTIKSADIELKLGTQEFPEILKSTPGVYATKAGGGYGDGRINLRGFDSENVAVMINGIPVNDMENGRVFWSNWAGLGDVTSTMQVQRGLGASKLAVPSIGGTINIITKTTDVEAGGNISTTIANDGYEKFGITYSTGLLENGFAATVSAATTEGNGYVDGTEFNGVSYFVNLSKEINENHKLSFSAFGSKQRHGQRQNRQLIETYKNSDRGRKFNADWGYYNGQVTHQEDNFYNKPQISLNHYWTLSEKTSIISSAYVSFGSGGGGGTRGVNKFTINADGSSDYRTGLFGPLDFDKISDENAALGANGSETILRASRNDHNWYGLLSTLKTDLSDDLVLLTGVDFRSYKGIHFQEVTNLLGGQYFLDDNNENNPNNPAKVGDKINYNNDGKVGWLGFFGQLEYDVNEKFNTFIALAASNTSYQRIDYFNYLDSDPLQETDKYNFFGFSAKAGANYRIDENHNVFANLGYFEKAADFDSVFLNFSNDNINADAENQKITSYELGYGFRGDKLSANVNLYRTTWNDRTETATFQQPDGTRATANILGVNAIHQGIEIDFVYRASEKISFTGMASLGDWRWDSDVTNVSILDEEQNIVDTVNLFIKDLHVSDAAQTAFALGANYKLSSDTRLVVDYNYYADIYADYDPSDRGTQGAPDAWKMPDYGLFDLALNHNFKFGPFDATLTGRMNNVFDTEYISDAQDGAGSTDDTALVWFGYGRTFSVGAKLNF
ncbi:TonB-dependent receptor [Jejuia spongiicola]|uniref:TonB-dependent receptor n=1 Tax=Jejuia spongiicola TaxID=2942207 RepID=A0ABT0Q9S0_9FLAO|nr:MULTISPECIES: TonB-dependent receptor [Flavobacteriaceae]MCL6293727.1 TonB-dependent receptor [Jejuia spongiicola]PIA78719.1 TonB-dependent receptor [Gaetbulibacter sp. 4G1]